VPCWVFFAGCVSKTYRSPQLADRHVVKLAVATRAAGAVRALRLGLYVPHLLTSPGVEQGCGAEARTVLESALGCAQVVPGRVAG
jgi:hypothetical protein